MSETVSQQQRELGTGPVLPTLIKLSLPAIGMMFLNTLVFLVDSIFVSWLGEDQMAAMSLSLPVAIAVFALLEGAGNGTTALVGQNLGRGNSRAARVIAISGLALAYGITLATLPFLFHTLADGIFNTLGARGDRAVIDAAYAYNFWWPFTLPFIAFTYIGNCAFRCQGNTMTPLMVMVISNVVNVILDPLFIFTFGMGISGAAVATLIGRICATIYLFYKLKRASNIKLPIFPSIRRSLFAYWKPIAVIGFPVTLSSGSVALGFGWLNKILAGFGNYAVVALMMSLRIEDFSFTVIMGICTALTPFLAYNYGRRDLSRIIEGMKAAMLIAAVIMSVLGAVLFVFPHLFIDLFKPTPQAADMAVLSMRWAIASYPFLIPQFIMNALFIATGYSAFGTITQLIRSIIVRVPVAYLFAYLWGDRGIWAFQPVSWFICAVISWAFTRYLVNRMKNTLLLDEIRSA